jgi:hypothetical protein
MDKTAQNTPNWAISGHLVENKVPHPAAGLPVGEISMIAAELRAIDGGKLAAIRLAIDKGDYDSDAILEKALSRMLERLEESENEQ